MENSRHIKYDVIRVFAMALVIAVHSNPKPFPENSLGSICFYTILYMCNGLFYMLSGNLNLKKEFTQKEHYISFYKSKCITLLFPFLLASILQSIYTYEGEFRIDWMLKTILRGFLADNAGTHLWFMYPLIGFTLSTPFLSKMLHAMTDWELKILFSAGIIWQIISISFCANVGISYAFSGWFLSSWAFHYFMGYFVHRIVSEANKRYFYFGTPIGLFLTVTLKYFFKDAYTYAYDLSIVHILLVLGVYVFFLSEINIHNVYLQKIITTLSKHSFTVYLLHNIIKKELSKQLNTININLFSKYLLHFALTFCISLIFSIIVDTFILKPIQTFFKKI